MAKKYVYRSSRRKYALAVIAVMLLILSYSTYHFYQENVRREGIINTQVAEIAAKGAVISGQGNTIELLKFNVTKQSLKIQGQQSELANKSLQIQNLSGRVLTLQESVKEKINRIFEIGQKLGSAQSEIAELTPAVKSHYVIGVDGGGQGFVIPLEIKVRKGTGLVSVNIKNVDLQSGVQDSIRIATAIASAYTQIDTAGKDIDISFVNQLPQIVSVDGPSGGAAVTATLIAALQDRTMNGRILLTGTIEPDGRIGPVGSVLGKATAVKSFGATTFLVPAGQNVTVEGLQVVEVRTITEVAGLVIA